MKGWNIKPEELKLCLSGEKKQYLNFVLSMATASIAEAAIAGSE